MHNAASSVVLHRDQDNKKYIVLGRVAEDLFTIFEMIKTSTPCPANISLP